jgi:hypothetical protein
MFERIQKVTAIKKYMRQHPEANLRQANDACKQEGYKGGIHLAPKDLRDYFCTEIAARSNDPAVAMRLMRHTNLATTTKYMRTVENRMRDAVQNLGCDSGCDSMAAKGLEMSQLAKLEQVRELAKTLERYGFLNEKLTKVNDESKVDHMDFTCPLTDSFQIGCFGVELTRRRRRASSRQKVLIIEFGRKDDSLCRINKYKSILK